jgi:hypothetical protein
LFPPDPCITRSLWTVQSPRAMGTVTTTSSARSSVASACDSPRPPNTGACGRSAGSRIVAGTNRMQPLATVESSTANQNVAVRRSSVSGQYAMSWCQAKTASSLYGCLARSWS